MAAYVSVTWTTGDVITEAKLDNMVNNDQSEDAHETNGLQLANNVAYKAKQAGGTVKDLIKLGTDDILRLSQIRTQTDDSDSISNTTSENVIVQMGWGQLVGDGTAQITESVTFPTAFSTVLGVLMVPLAAKATTAAADITGLTTSYGTVAVSAVAESVSTTGFTASLSRNTGTFSATVYHGYAWIAWGTKA